MLQKSKYTLLIKYTTAVKGFYHISKMNYNKSAKQISEHVHARKTKRGWSWCRLSETKQTNIKDADVKVSM